MYVVKKCISNELYIFACQNNNFLSLNQLDVTYHKANKIVSEFVSTKGCNALICFFSRVSPSASVCLQCASFKIYHAKPNKFTIYDTLVLGLVLKEKEQIMK